jgi:leucyl/phenylalanyl-tRNA--protein transferase
MAVIWLPREHAFPDPRHADDEVVAAGGDLSPRRVLAAYACGIFPWPHEGLPLLWFSPNPRFVLRLGELKVARSLRQVIRKRRFEIRLDSAFGDVMRGCAGVKRKRQKGTWITPEMIECYERLHGAGFAHCAEAWLDGELAGGLYGVSLGGMFCGESMFAKVDDASKVAFVTLCAQLARWDFDFIDAQTHSAHMERFGARALARPKFLDALAQTLKKNTRKGTWKLDEDLARGPP